MKAEVKVILEDGSELNNPTMVLGDSITYKQSVNKVEIECIFSEENSSFKHSRQYSFDTEGKQLTKPDVMILISLHPELSKFK